MNRKRSIVGVCLLAALTVACVTAPGIAAAKGTTAFTCKKTGKGSFTKAHCASGDVGAGEYNHVEIEEKKTTVLTARNRETSGAFAPWKLKSTIGVNALELEFGEAALVGTIENKMVALEHTAIGTGFLFFRKVTVLNPAGCVVNKDNQPGVGTAGEIESNQLSYLTAQQGDALKISRPFGGGEVLATFYLQKCTNAALNGTYNLKGSFTTSSIDGATGKFTHANTTAQKTLTVEAAAAGLEGELTFEARDPDEETYTPLAFTTVG